MGAIALFAFYDLVVLDMSSMLFTTKQAQIPRHLNPAKCGDILVQCKVAHFEDFGFGLILDASLQPPRIERTERIEPYILSVLALANLTQSKHRKHAIPHEQANHAHTYGKFSDNFERFL